MVAELQHRTRNLLAVVRNVARRSIPSSPGRDEYDARLAALGRVQGFLSRSLLYTVPLADLVEAEATLPATGRNLAGVQGRWSVVPDRPARQRVQQGQGVWGPRPSVELPDDVSPGLGQRPWPG